MENNILTDDQRSEIEFKLNNGQFKMANGDFWAIRKYTPIPKIAEDGVQYFELWCKNDDGQFNHLFYTYQNFGVWFVTDVKKS